MRLILFLACVSSLWAIQSTPITVEIEKVQDKEMTFHSSTPLKRGQSGIVLTNIENNDIIIASAEIVKIHHNDIIASYKPFKIIAQKYLPTPQATPKAGDKILFFNFYDKSIAIAPNQEIYNKIIALAPNIHFLHIDLFSATLAKDGINDPKEKHFRSFCSAYSVGLLHIFASNGINVLDCQTFALLEVLPLEKPSLQSTDAPFFSRIPYINTGSLMSKLRSKKSRQYFHYYDNLLQDSIKAFNDKE